MTAPLPPLPATDWHCHLLPGFDDGPETLAESLAMARLLAGAGIRTLYCTPHCIKGSYEFAPDQVRAAVATLQAELARAGIPLSLQSGMEYTLDEFLPGFLAAPLPLGATDLLLVEIPSHFPAPEIKPMLFEIRRRRLTPLIAHPERCRHLGTRSGSEKPPSRLARWLSGAPSLPAAALEIEELLAMGCELQGNLGSFTGQYGAVVRQRALSFQQQGHYARYGSDGHSAALLSTLLPSFGASA